jgi:ribonuclease HI
MGVIAPDAFGKFIAANCKEIHFVADPFMAEAYALREGLSLAQFLGCNKIIIQSDNSQVIDTMKEGGFSATSSAAIFDDCRLLATGFREITFEHCNREANEIAHEARHSFHDRINRIWDDDVPSFFSLSS